MPENELTAIADAVRRAKSVAIFTHARPDPDAIGSQVGDALMLAAMGKQVSVMCLPPRFATISTHAAAEVSR